MTGSVLGNRDGARTFTLADFAGITTGLTGADRLAVFHKLPAVMREQAWAKHDAEVEARSEQLWQESQEC